MTTFDSAFNFTIGNESRRYVNDPADSGGPTKFGITISVYENFFGKPVLGSEIELMSEDTAKQIYMALYWHRMSCGAMTTPAIAICLFDTGVLYGVGTASLLAQHALSICGATIKLDGIIGDNTVSFLNSVVEDSFISTFRGLVLERIDTVITNNPKDERFRSGWAARADRLLTLLDVNVLNQLQGES